MRELWLFDIQNYQWSYVNTTNTSTSPTPREQHAAVQIENSLYIFGGKSRSYPSYEDTIYDDLWKLTVPKQEHVDLVWNETSRMLIQGSRQFFSINNTNAGYKDQQNIMENRRNGMCIQSMRVKVQYFCLRQTILIITGGTESFMYTSS